MLNQFAIVRGISSPERCQQIIDKLAWCENNPMKLYLAQSEKENLSWKIRGKRQSHAITFDKTPRALHC